MSETTIRPGAVPSVRNVYIAIISKPLTSFGNVYKSGSVLIKHVNMTRSLFGPGLDNVANNLKYVSILINDSLMYNK